ncbi:MAG: hypothetical protein AB7H97_21825 [Pseudobdellovibrionaceae bacterium]
MKLEVTKVYRTHMTINYAKNYATYFKLSSSQQIVLNEAVDKAEKQDSSIKTDQPKSYEVSVSPLKDGKVTMTPVLTSAKLEWIKFDAKGIASKPRKFDAPFELKKDDLIELYGPSDAEPSTYEVSFRFSLTEK